MALNVLTSQLSESVEYIVPRRQKDFDYIKRAHQGKVHWLNTVLLSKTSIVNSFVSDKIQKRIHRWFILGVSFSRLLEMQQESNIIRAASQLLEEYEHFITHEKEMKKQNTNNYSHRKPLPILQFKDNDVIKPALHKLNRTVVYEYLLIPFTCINDSMDYCEVVYTLCDTLILLYSKFHHDEICSLSNVRDAILKFDKNIRKYIIGKICNDLTDIATVVMKKEMMSILNHMFVDESKSNKITRKYYQLSGDLGKKKKSEMKGGEDENDRSETEN